ncbi:MAG: YkvA family protein [Cyanobacteria bacterium J06650_10]
MKKQNKQQNRNSISNALHNLYRKALKHTKYRWVVILGTLFYLVNPFDISPDFLPVLGWIDDGLIASLLISEVGQIVSEELRRKQIFDATTKTEIETVIETDNIKTINVEAVSIS